MTSVAKQIGNAVCPRLAEQIAARLAAAITAESLRAVAA